MLIKRETLLKDLSACMPALSAGGTNPNNYFTIINNGNKTLLCTTNEEIAIMLPLEYYLPSMKIRGTELFLSVKSMEQGSSFDVSLEDTFVIRTNESQTSIEIALEQVSLFDTIPEVNSWKKLPDDFIEKITLASRCTASDSSSSIKFMYVYAAEDRVIGSDGLQFLYSNLNGNVDKMFIKRSAIKALTNCKPKFYSVGEEWLQFKNDDGIIFALRTISNNERYPIVVTLSDWTSDELAVRKDIIIDNLIKISGNEIVFDNISKLSTVINSCRIFTKDTVDKEEITILIKDKKMLITGFGNHGCHKRQLPIDSDINIKFKINPNLLISALESGNKFIVNKDCIGIIGDNFTHIVQLIGI